MSKHVKIIDIRHSSNRTGEVKVKNLQEFEIEKLINLIENKKFKEDLIFIDENGRRNKWLFYYLTTHFKNKFYFLIDGQQNKQFSKLTKA